MPRGAGGDAGRRRAAQRLSPLRGRPRVFHVGERTHPDCRGAAGWPPERGRAGHAETALAAAGTERQAVAFPSTPNDKVCPFVAEEEDSPVDVADQVQYQARSEWRRLGKDVSLSVNREGLR